MTDYNDIAEEEEILGFPIWVAELELIVGSARGKKKPDPVQCFQLLQKLIITLDRTASSDIRPHQRRCEDALVDILLKGAPPPVRRLVCEILSKLYSRGDQLPLYSRASALQLFLGTKEASGRETAEDVRLGALECMTTLYYKQGQQLSIGVHETAQLATKYTLKSHAKGTRRTALRLMAAAVEGVGSNHRMALQVQEIVLKAVEKILSKEGKNAPEPVKIGCADVLRALGASGGACFWVNNHSSFDHIRSVCLEFLEDSTSEAVRSAFATALGQIAAAASSDAAIATFKSPPDNNNNSNSNSNTEAGHRKKAASQEKALAEVPTQCLTTPFTEAAAATNRQLCTSLAKTWVVYLSALRYRQTTMTAGRSSLSSSLPPESQDDTSLFLDELMKPLDAVSAVSMSTGGAPEKPIGQYDAELGAGISSGERPHGQACALYIMRVGGIEALGEQAQRALLIRLAVFLSTPAGLPVPAAVVGLESIALLLEVLGEAGEEARAALEPQIAAKLAGPSQALRLQAASTLGALALAEAGSAARLLAACLANLRSSLAKLQEATAVKGRGDRSRPLVPGTPRGIGSAKIKDELNSVHGWALGISALLSIIIALPLGVPSRLISAALDVAIDLANGSLNAEATEQQGGSAGVSGLLAAQAVKREAGHIMLGALCLAMPREQLAGSRRVYFLELWKPALGTDSAALLDTACRASSSGAEHALAQEIWWRLSALDSLMAYVHVVIPTSLSLETRNQLAKNVAELLAPILTVISNQPILQDQTKASRGGPAGPLAASISYLHLKLLQVFLSLPPTLYSEEQQVQLMQLSMRAVASANGAGGQPPLGLLRRWLDSRDAQLGPWGDGAHLGGGQDPLEAALLCFEGSAGGPATYLPWEAGLRLGVGYRLPSENGQFREGGVTSDDDDENKDRGSGSSDEEDGGEQRTDNHKSSSGKGVTEKKRRNSNLLPTTPTSSSLPRPFSQNESLGIALLGTHVAMIGALFKCVPKTDILEMLDALLQPLTRADVAVQQRKKDKSCRQALVIAAVAAALAGSSGLKNNNNDNTNASTGNGEVSSRYVTMARMALDEALAAASPPSGHNNNPNYEISEHGFSPIVCILLRSSADLFAAAAALAPDTEALSLVKAVCREMADTGSLPQRAALALAVGGMSRALGGLSLQAIIQPAAETLLAAAAASDTSIAPWLLHSILTCAYAAGLSFMPFVSGTLALDLRMLLSEAVYSLSGLLPAIGRLANGMVAVLGPEYMPGSSAYISCKSIINDMKALDGHGGGGGHRSGNDYNISSRNDSRGGKAGGEDALSAMLETVLYSQMLVLFAPRAAGETGTVAKRMGITLLSRQPRLRKAASDTLRHLTERDPEGVATAGIEATLFEALDGETDPTIAAQIKATLKTLLTADGPKRPSKWIALCADVIAAHAPGGSQQQQQTIGSGSGGSGDAAKSGGLAGERGSDSEDDDENGGNVNTTSDPVSARSTVSDSADGSQLQQQIPNSARRAAGLTPRLKTRLFAAACLLHLPKLVCSSDPRHTQVTASQLRGLPSFDDDDGDWLVLKLQQLVDLGFKMVGGQLEALRPLGVTLLTKLVDTFGTVVDLLAEDVMAPPSVTSTTTAAHTSRPLLMQLYQAQLVSALRASLSPDASPPLRAAGATLAVAFLENNLAGGDAVVLDRLMSLLAAPLFYHDRKNPLLLGGSGGGVVSFKTKASSSSLPLLTTDAKQPEATGVGGDNGSPRGTPNAAPSSSSSSSPVQPYADWVEAKARAALLEAHAHCTLLAASAVSSTDSEQVLKTKRIVNESQRRHRDQLVDWWFGLLQDYVVLCREPEDVQVGYKPAVWSKNVPCLAPGSRSLVAGSEEGGEGGGGGGGISKTTLTGGKEEIAAQKQQHKTAAPLAMVMATRPALEKAWPAVLEATAVIVASRLGISSDTEIQLRQAVLLDIIEAGLCVAWETRSEVHLAAALSALQQLTTPAFLQREWITASAVSDLSEMVLKLVRDIIYNDDDTHSNHHHHHYKVTGKVAMATASISKQLATYSTSFSAAKLLIGHLTHRAAALLNMTMHEKNASLTTLLEAMSVHVCHCLSLKVGDGDNDEGGESKMASAMLLALDVLTYIAEVDDTQQLQQQDISHAVVEFISSVADEVEMGSMVLPSTVMSLAGIAKQAVAANNAVVVGAALSAMLECTHAVVIGGRSGGGGSVVKLTLENVGLSAVSSKHTHIQASAMKALRIHLQKLQQRKVLAPEWALRCVVILGPPATATVHKLNQEQPGTLLEAGSVVEYENEMILETFKVLLLCVTLLFTVVAAEDRGEGGGRGESVENAPQSLLKLLVPLLIEGAGNISRPEVSNTCVHMLTGLASSAAGELFKTQVAALPVGVKQRLHAAIQAKAGGGGGGDIAAGQQAAALKSGIQLKSFAQLKRQG